MTGPGGVTERKGPTRPGRRVPASLLAVLLVGCGGGEAETPAAATQRGIDRSVADIQAAEAAARGPVEVSRSVGELSGKQEASGDGSARADERADSENEESAATAER